MKILIVDDEDIQRQKLVQLISESALSFSDILCAPEVPTAIDIIETHHPDIVLSDIRMPVKNGLDLAQYVKETYSLFLLRCISVLKLQVTLNSNTPRLPSVITYLIIF